MTLTGLFREMQDFAALAPVFGLLKKGGSGAPECLLKTEWVNG